MRKGQVMTKEQRLKISQAHLGMKKPWVSKKSPEHLKAISEALKGNRNCVGRVPSQLHRERIRQSLLGKKRPFKPRPKAKGRIVWNKGKKLSPEHKAKCSLAMKGRTHSEAWKKMMSDRFKGENNPVWIKDRTKLVKTSRRFSTATKDWRNACGNRDSWKCRLSDESCINIIHIHHIKPWRNHPELRYDVNNGITLCRKHHPRKFKEEERLAPIFQKLIAS